MLVVAKSATDPRWLGRRTKKIVQKANTAEVERLLSQQSQMTAKIRTAVMQAVGRIQSQIDVDQIAALLKQGRTQEAIASINAQMLQQGYRSVANAITQATVASGVSAAAALADVPELSQLDILFGLTNPNTISYLQRYEMNLITGLSQDSLASVRAAIQQGVMAGQNPLTIAQDIRQFIGLTPRQTQAVMNYRSYLDNLDTSALTRTLRDARFDPTISSAIENDSSLAQEYIDKVVGRYQSRMLAYRADTIARTEALRAVNAGNHQLWQQAVSDGKVAADQVVRKWSYTHDGRTRPAHVAIPSMNPDGVGLNEAFDTPLGPLMFPGDPDGDPSNTINCRCAVIFRIKTTGAPASDNSLSSLFSL